MQIAKTNWAWLTRQTDPDFMFDVKSQQEKWSWLIVRILTAFPTRSYFGLSLVMWSCTHDSLFFFSLYYCFFFLLFVAIMAWLSERNTNSLRIFPYAAAMSLLSCCRYRVKYWWLLKFFSPIDVNIAVPHPLAIGLLFIHRIVFKKIIKNHRLYEFMAVNKYIYLLFGVPSAKE
jgi:hypothetical protein